MRQGRGAWMSGAHAFTWLPPGPASRFVLHRRLVLVCFMVPFSAGVFAALLVPQRGSASALLLVSAAESAVSDGPAQAWVPWDAASYVARGLQPLRVYATEDPAVVRVEVTATTAQSAVEVMARVLGSAGNAALGAPPPQTHRANPGETAGVGLAGLDEDRSLASRRIAELTQRADALEQQAEGAKAVMAAASQALAGQPQTLPDAWETEPKTPSDAERALLLSLMIEREHLVSQYAADFPAIQEVNRKIAAVQAEVAGDGRVRRVAVRDVRNPTAVVLAERLALSRLAADDASAQARIVERQLTQARAHSADLARAQDAARDASQASPMPQPLRPQPLGPQIAVLSPPVARPADWTLIAAMLLFGTAAGAALAGIAAAFQRWTFALLLPVDRIRLRADSPLTAVPHLGDALAGTAAPQLLHDAELAGAIRR